MHPALSSWTTVVKISMVALLVALVMGLSGCSAMRHSDDSAGFESLGASGASGSSGSSGATYSSAGRDVDPVMTSVQVVRYCAVCRTGRHVTMPSLELPTADRPDTNASRAQCGRFTANVQSEHFREC